MRAARIAIEFAAAISIAAGALAQSYPTKPVRVIVPFTAGSGIDAIGARPVSQKLAEIWGQTVVVDNRTGAGGTIGAGLVAKSPADGYTLLINSAAHVTNPLLYSNPPYDASKDFVVVAPLVRMVNVLVVAPSVGVKNVSELIAAARAKPGQLNFASSGTGTGTHFTAEKFKLMAGIDVMHIPYKGGPEAMTDVMTGRVTYWIPSIGTALPFIQGGKLLALGVSSRQRSAALPGVPTLDEAGLAGFDDAIWIGMWAPAGTPTSIVDKLGHDVARALAMPDLRERLAANVAEPMPMTPAEFTRFTRSETEAAARVIKAAGIKPQ
jgi:tripartite-type tricarboxylate transporter receptor subunit TctC